MQNFLDWSPIWLLLILVGYCIGSIPFAVWWGRWRYGIDIRHHGSGNAGATNTLRVLGWKAGLVVLLFDIGKGFFSVWLASRVADAGAEVYRHVWLMIVGIAAVLGHLFPMWLAFRGGKGVATLFGVVLCLFPNIAALAAVGFVVVLMLTLYVSLASMVGALCFPVGLWIWYPTVMPEAATFAIGTVIPALIIFTHRQNIVRLLNGTENRFLLRQKRT